MRHYARTVAVRTGVDHIARAVARKRLLIVTYHGLREDSDPTRHWLLLPRSQFRDQLAFLVRHYRLCPIDQALNALWEGRLDAPTACITFDDGYRSNLTVGLPELRAFGVPATVYLATGLIGTGQRLWTTRIELALQRTQRRCLDLAALGLGEIDLSDTSVRAKVANQTREYLKTLTRPAREAVMADLLDQAGDTGDGQGDAFALMDWGDVRRLESSGLVTFGAHTVNHQILSPLADGELAEEITESIRTVEHECSALSRTFAYPNGLARDFDTRAAAVVRAAGCVAAVCTVEGLNEAATDPFALRRISVGSDMTLHDFRFRVCGLDSAVRRILRSKVR